MIQAKVRRPRSSPCPRPSQPMALALAQARVLAVGRRSTLSQVMCRQTSWAIAAHGMRRLPPREGMRSIRPGPVSAVSRGHRIPQLRLQEVFVTVAWLRDHRGVQMNRLGALLVRTRHVEMNSQEMNTQGVDSMLPWPSSPLAWPRSFMSQFDLPQIRIGFRDLR